MRPSFSSSFSSFAEVGAGVEEATSAGSPSRTSDESAASSIASSSCAVRPSEAARSRRWASRASGEGVTAAPMT